METDLLTPISEEVSSGQTVQVSIRTLGFYAVPLLVVGILEDRYTANRPTAIRAFEKRFARLHPELASTYSFDYSQISEDEWIRLFGDIYGSVNEIHYYGRPDQKLDSLGALNS